MVITAAVVGDTAGSQQDRVHAYIWITVLGSRRWKISRREQVGLPTCQMSLRANIQR